ncbi:hypothetical protein E3N88_34473 [Mikania micrantha]|uniref:Uncharacterized protein n=1 Tax=Mikania micrantha TaxID=192012 RepID=A0A5N6M0V3_9ASTR|nr:hypothetical protein E3N88_34473 [Mikania micrantha]
MFKMASKRFLFIALAFATALLVTSEIVAARELASNNENIEDIAMVDMEGTTMAGVIEADIAGMVVVVTEISIIEDVGVALLFKRQSHTNKLMRHKLTIDLSMLS